MIFIVRWKEFRASKRILVKYGPNHSVIFSGRNAYDKKSETMDKLY